jgi:HPt (histidine-containing phosphotransfer) domain-containing protein
MATRLSESWRPPQHHQSKQFSDSEGDSDTCKTTVFSRTCPRCCFISDLCSQISTGRIFLSHKTVCNVLITKHPYDISGQRVAAFRLQRKRMGWPHKMDIEFKASGNALASWSMTSELQEIADTDPSMIPELFTLFLDDSVSRLQTLAGACVREDFKIIRNQAHSLKGSALQMGASGMAALCAALEKSDRPGTEQREAMTNAIDDEFALVRRAIEQYMVRTQSPGAC